MRLLHRVTAGVSSSAQFPDREDPVGKALNIRELVAYKELGALLYRMPAWTGRAATNLYGYFAPIKYILVLAAILIQ